MNKRNYQLIFDENPDDMPLNSPGQSPANNQGAHSNYSGCRTPPGNGLYRMSWFWISATFLLTVAVAAAETLTVYVTTEGPRQGVIDILVFTGRDGFPNRPDKAFRRARTPVTGEDPVTCVITNLPYGTYSLSVLHDINDNCTADKMLGFGPPKEPVGFSNIKGKMRRQPDFKSTVIPFNAQTNETAVALWYVL